MHETTQLHHLGVHGLVAPRRGRAARRARRDDALGSEEGQLEDLGARYTEQRVVQNGKIITAAGVSSGIDMALTLAAQLTDPVTAQVMQLFIEYDPQPPFDTGAASKATDEVWARVAELRVTR